MINIGDRVKIIIVCDRFSPEAELASYGFAHGLEGIVDMHNEGSPQPYHVAKIDGTSRGLWCSVVEPVYKPIELPKELFEI